LTAKKITRITVETHQVWILRRRERLVRVWCKDCVSQVNAISPERAGALGEVTARTIYRWLEAGRLHFFESRNGAVSICLNSLADFLGPLKLSESDPGNNDEDGVG
jgi:hypothetical protein